MLINKSGAKRDEDFGKIMGVTKSAVGLWKNGKSPIPIEKFLTAFGQETLDWIKQEYNLDDKQTDNESEEVLKAEARKIQLLFDRGLIQVERKQEGKSEKLKLVAEEVGRYETDNESVPLYQHLIAAGPCTDSSGPVEEHLDLPGSMIPHPADTYAVKVTGDSMKGDNIEEGDILIVDCTLEPQHNNIVIASVDNEQTVKRLKNEDGKITLMPSNHHYEPIEITEHTKLDIQGVVTWVIRRAV